MSDSTDGTEDDDLDSVIPKDFEVSEEKRQEDRNRVNFEWCEIIRDIGEAYQETNDIDEAADRFGLDLNETREAAIVYRLILEDPPRDISFGAHTTAIDFFDGGHNIESLTRGEGDEGVEQSKQYIKEFVGAVYRVHDVEGVNEIGEIPDELDLDVPELDFNLDNHFSGLSALGNIMPLFSDQIINGAFADTPALARAISAMNFQEELQNITIAVNTLPPVAEQLQIPDETFAEIAEVFNTADTLQASLTNVPEIQQFGEVDQPTRPAGEREEEIQEKLPQHSEELEEKDVEDIEPEEAVKYSVKVVGGSLSKPKTREWYLSVGSRTQTTIVRVLLFSAVLVFTSGNVVIASAVAMVLGPGFADMLSNQLEDGEEIEKQ